MKGNKKEKNVNQKKGISLIVLVITIIVIVILAVAVILSIADNNPISNANKAKFQNDVKSIQEELELTKAKNYADNSGKSYGTISIGDLKGAEKYKDKFVINEGELRYLASKLSSEELEWATELGIKAGGVLLADGYKGVSIDAEDTFSTNWGPWNNGESVPSDIGSDVIIPEKVKTIKARAFQNITEIVSVTMPDTVSKIEDNAFWGCSNLKNVTLSKDLKTIGIYAFAGCTSLVSVTFPEGLTSIGSGAFGSCTSLTNVILPEGMTNIDMGAFEGCTLLRILEIPDSLKDSDLEAIGGSGLPNLTVKISKETIQAIWPEIQTEEAAASKMRVGEVIFK